MNFSRFKKFVCSSIFFLLVLDVKSALMLMKILNPNTIKALRRGQIDIRLIRLYISIYRINPLIYIFSFYVSTSIPKFDLFLDFFYSDSY